MSNGFKTHKKIFRSLDRPWTISFTILLMTMATAERELEQPVLPTAIDGSNQ